MFRFLSWDFKVFSLNILTSWNQVLYLAAKQIQVLTHIARCRIQDRPLKSFMPHTCCSPYAHRFTRFLKVKRKSIIYDDVVKGIFPFGLGASCFHGWWLRLHSTRSQEGWPSSKILVSYRFPIWSQAPSYVFIVNGVDHRPFFLI